MYNTINPLYSAILSPCINLAVNRLNSPIIGAATRVHFDGTRKDYPVPSCDPDTDRCWLIPEPYNVLETYDKWDENDIMKMCRIDSDTVDNYARLFNRVAETVILDALRAPRTMGLYTAAKIDLNKRSKIAVDYSAEGPVVESSLTMDKIIRAKSLLDDSDVPEEDRYIVLNKTQVQLLLSSTDENSNAYPWLLPLAEGKPTQYLNFNFIVSPYTPKDGSCKVMAFHKSGVNFSMNNIQSSIRISPDYRHALQVYTEGMIGAVRTDDSKVVEISCREN